MISPELFKSLLDRLASTNQDPPPSPPTPSPPSLDVDEDVRSMALSKINQALTKKGDSATDRVHLYKRALNSFKKHSDKSTPDHTHGRTVDNVGSDLAPAADEDNENDDEAITLLREKLSLVANAWQTRM